MTKSMTHICGVALTLLLCCTLTQTGYAAVGDQAYNECLQELGRDPDALTNEVWRKPPVPLEIQEQISPDLYGDTIIRWISHKNSNGTVSFSALVRDPGPQSTDDPDLFFVIFQRGTHYSVTAPVAANAFSFSKHKAEGVNGLLFCTHGSISEEWIWDGSAWK